jgi:hypothetical protein
VSGAGVTWSLNPLGIRPSLWDISPHRRPPARWTALARYFMQHHPIPVEAIPQSHTVALEQLIVALDAPQGGAAGGRSTPGILSCAWIWPPRSSRCRRSLDRPFSFAISRNFRLTRLPIICCSRARGSTAVSPGFDRCCRHISSAGADVGCSGRCPVAPSGPRRDGLLSRARPIPVILGAGSRAPGEAARAQRVRNACGSASESSRIDFFTGDACAIACSGMLDANDAQGLQSR